MCTSSNADERQPRPPGSEPSRRPGDLVRVGCLIDSDHSCAACSNDVEQSCPNATFTYNSPDAHLGGVTYGGYSERIVVNESFVLQIPDGLDAAGAAPLLCAGITTDVEIIPIQQINEACERMLSSDVKYRFSIDMASLK